MTLGKHLARIAETEGTEREILKEDFLKRIEGHKEENLLRACYTAACFARLTYICFNKEILPPPQELETEGFTLKANSCGYKYCFG